MISTEALAKQFRWHGLQYLNSATQLALWHAQQGNKHGMLQMWSRQRDVTGLLMQS
jgi:hypothetical protein